MDDGEEGVNISRESRRPRPPPSPLSKAIGDGEISIVESRDCALASSFSDYRMAFGDDSRVSAAYLDFTCL